MAKGINDTNFYLLGRLQAGLTTFLNSGKKKKVKRPPFDDAPIVTTRTMGTL